MTEDRKAREQHIGERLRALRLLRTAAHFPWLAVVFFAVVYYLLPPDWAARMRPVYAVFFAWAAAGFFLTLLIRRFPCPRCGERFHYRRRGERFLSLYAYNDFAVKCGECGLRLDGRNAAD